MLNKKTILNIFIFLFLPLVVKATEFIPDVKIGNFKGGKITGTTVGEYIGAIANYAIASVGIIAAFAVMWAGFLWIAAGGNQQRIAEAKNRFLGALLGLILALNSYLVLYIINPELTKIQDVSALINKGKQTQQSSATYFDSKKEQIQENGILTLEERNELLQECIDIGGSKEKCLEQLNKLENTNLTKVLTPEEIYSLVAPATVKIMAPNEFASGIVLNKQGYILTNAYFLNVADGDLQVEFFDGTIKNANIVSRDSNLNLVIIKIESNNYKVVALGNSDSLVSEDRVHAFGHPGGISEISNKDGLYIRKTNIDDIVYLESTVKSNSGGPLINKYGEIIGIFSGSDSPDLNIPGIGLAIPINNAKVFIDSVIN